MIINALNSGANVFMADFEDSNSPTWLNNVSGQFNLRDAVNRSISFSANGKEYALKEKIATLVVRPRGWHLDEGHFLVNGEPVSASLFDFGLYFFHNAKNSVDAVLICIIYFNIKVHDHFINITKGIWSILLPSKNGISPGSALMERCI